MSHRHETSTHYTHPYRPIGVSALNAVGRLTAKLDIQASLSPSSLKKVAMHRNQLENFGSPPVDEPLGHLVRALECEASLSPLGRVLTREHLISALGNRLRAQKLFTDHPEILAQPVATPWVIVGLQRTGTTFLQRLLSADPEARSMPFWEALNPSPKLPYNPAHDTRRKKARTACRVLAYLSPDFSAIHPVEYEACEEDSLLLDLSLLSPVIEATLRVPSYGRWLAKQDMTPAYLLEKTLLQLLHWQRPAGRWLLKTPAHLPFLDILIRTFPNAKIIHIHRSPRHTVASFCSMIAHGRSVFSDTIDPLALGQELLKKQRDILLTGLNHRENPTIRKAIIDVEYDELVSDPLAVVERIYRFAGEELRHRNAIEAESRRHNQHRFGQHRYDLSSFGLTQAEVDEAFGPYLEWYDSAKKRV